MHLFYPAHRLDSRGQTNVVLCNKQADRPEIIGYRILLYGTETLELSYIFRDKILDHFDGLVGFRKGLSSEVMMHSLKHTQFDVATSI